MTAHWSFDIFYAWSTPLNAIMIRATADQLALAATIIAEQDQPKPVVTFDVKFLEVDPAEINQLGLLPPVPQSRTTGPTVIVVPQALVTFLAGQASTRTLMDSPALQVPQVSLRTMPRGFPEAEPTVRSALQDGSVGVDIFPPKVLSDRSVFVGIALTIGGRTLTTPLPSYDTRVSEGESMMVVNIPATGNQRDILIVIQPRVVIP